MAVTYRLAVRIASIRYWAAGSHTQLIKHKWITTSLAHHAVSVLGTVLVVSCGCHSNKLTDDFITQLGRQSLVCLKMAAVNDQDPPIRAQAIQALAFASEEEALPWIRQGLYDEDEEVRCAACLTLYKMGNRETELSIRRLLEDDNILVRLCAMLFLAKTGATKYQARLNELVLQSTHLMHGETAVTLLREISEHIPTEQLRNWLHAASNDNSAVALAAKAALVKRGDPAITKELMFSASTGDQDRQTGAIEMLADSTKPKVLYTLLDRLKNCPYIEGRLAAARSLITFDRRDGLELALHCLEYASLSQTPASLERAAQIRILACKVCGNVRDESALIHLGKLFSVEQDLRIRIACAAAILEIIASQTKVGPNR